MAVTSRASPAVPTLCVHNIADVEYNVLDMRLMHYYSTVASREIFPGSNVREVWQTLLPIEAEAHPMLMHGILALSGAHMAHRPRPDTRLVLRSMQHEQIGLAKYRQQVAEAGDQCTAHPLPSFALLLVILAFAHLAGDCNSPTVVHFACLLQLFRGARSLSNVDRGSWSTGRFWPREQGPGASLNVSKKQAVCALLDQPVPGIEPGTVSDEAMQMLRSCTRKFARYPFDIRFLGCWPAHYSRDFNDMVLQRDPAALAVFARYSYVLAAEADRWFVGMLDSKLLLAIDEMLSAEGKIQIEWDLNKMLRTLTTIKELPDTGVELDDEDVVPPDQTGPCLPVPDERDRIYSSPPVLSTA